MSLFYPLIGLSNEIAAFTSPSFNYRSIRLSPLEAQSGVRRQDRPGLAG